MPALPQCRHPAFYDEAAMSMNDAKKSNACSGSLEPIGFLNKSRARVLLAIPFLLASFGMCTAKEADVIRFSCKLPTDRSETFFGVTSVVYAEFDLTLEVRKGTITRTYTDGEKYTLPVATTSDAVSWISKPTAQETRYSIDRRALIFVAEDFYEGKVQSKKSGECVVTSPSGMVSF